MIYNKNLKWIKKRAPQFYMKEFQQKTINPVEPIIEISKIGVPTLKIKGVNYSRYVHSKYNPLQESKKIAEQLELSNIEHIIFIGTGLGYHIKAITQLNPHLTFSIYEPNFDLMKFYLLNTDLTSLQREKLLNLSYSSIEHFIRDEKMLSNRFKYSKIQVYVLPALQEDYSNIEMEILKAFQEKLSTEKADVVTNAVFQRIWTTNAVKNLLLTLHTPSFINEMKHRDFSNEVAFLVAAGPSLSLEFENLKIIKEKKLGYILSVGSAINSLIEHDIEPDAAFTYDPFELNQQVFEKFKEKNISSVPLVFGSTVGYKTLNQFPSKMYHFITSQDTVTPYFVPSIDSTKIINDAPSIAVITLQLLMRVGFKKIVLVGQNLGYLNNRKYADGIEYKSTSSSLTEQEKALAQWTESVTGEMIQTSNGFLKMKQQLEMYIVQNPTIEVINTTIDGANIEGAPFKQLTNLLNGLKKIELRFFSNHENNSPYDISDFQLKFSRLNIYKRKLFEHLENLLKMSHNMNEIEDCRDISAIDKLFEQIILEIKNKENNVYFKHFVAPMIRNQRNYITDYFKKTRLNIPSNDEMKKLAIALHDYVGECVIHSNYIEEILLEVKEEYNQFQTEKSFKK